MERDDFELTGQAIGAKILTAYPATAAFQPRRGDWRYLVAHFLAASLDDRQFLALCTVGGVPESAVKSTYREGIILGWMLSTDARASTMALPYIDQLVEHLVKRPTSAQFTALQKAVDQAQEKDMRVRALLDADRKTDGWVRCSIELPQGHRINDSLAAPYYFLPPQATFSPGDFVHSSAIRVHDDYGRELNLETDVVPPINPDDKVFWHKGVGPNSVALLAVVNAPTFGADTGETTSEDMQRNPLFGTW